MKKNYIEQSGRSMIEMLGVLAVIGVLTVGGFSLVSKVSTAHKANVTIDEIGTLANKARTVFHEYVLDKKKNAQTPTMNAYLANAKAYPASLEFTDNHFVSNSDVVFDLEHFTTGEDKNIIDYFYIKVSQLDNEMCMTIAQSTWGSPSLNGYVGICVEGKSNTSCSGNNGGVVGTSKGTYFAKGGAKLSLDDSASACTGGTENTVYLTFR